ncbi:hypothetical protein [Streptomyces chartreusis]|uniref:hypothetical protein n=1 Tax=Streptomyces chartreusis TaxID=1969 RepID=UPI0035E3794C
MTRGSRGLCGLYLLVAAWLAWCTFATFGDVYTWVTLINAAASLVLIIAVIRETVIRDERRTVGRLVEEATRRTAWEGEPLPADGDPLDEEEQAAFGEIAEHFDDRSAA